MSHDELAPRGLLVLRLRGSQAEMGAQHGALLREAGGWEQTVDFYPQMAARMLSSGFPHGVRRHAERFAKATLGVPSRMLHAARRKHFPAYVARTEALLDAGALPRDHAPSMLVMEVLQNTVGLLGRGGALPAALAPAAVPACSSLAVWGPSSSDGTLRHARNFDFPGAGVWDEAPTVVFCEPDQGLRYGFVTTRGADVPGITAFNEAGITVTVHTRFHCDVSFDKPSVFDLGHEIVRSARTLSGAIDIARRHGSASTWGLVVSSARERAGVVIETTGSAVVPVFPRAGTHHVASTNRYLARELQVGEVDTSRAFVMDSNARFARLQEAVAEAQGGLSAEALEALLGDFRGCYGRDGTGDTLRLAGDCIVSPITVQSIVAEPEAEQIRVSVGRAPTGFGPYAIVPWSWAGDVGKVDVPLPTHAPVAKGHRGHTLSRDERAAVRAYSEVARLHLEGAAPDVVRARVEELVARAPEEPHFRTLAAFAAMRADDFERALTHLDGALAHEHGPYRRGRLLLFKSRVHTALGQREHADAARAELTRCGAAESVPERRAAEREAKRPLSRRRLRSLALDFHLLDARVPGALA